MRERYFYAGEYVTGAATYRDFRRFDVRRRNSVPSGCRVFTYRPRVGRYTWGCRSQEEVANARSTGGRGQTYTNNK